MGLRGPGDIDDLTEEEVDGVLAALVRRAPTDELAARALVQLLLPTCRRFVDAHAAPDRHAELAAAAVGAALAEVRDWAVAEGHVPASSGGPFLFGWAALMAS
jgi:hypothetical protein